MIAIIKTGGKQYLVKPNQTIQIEKIPGKEGESVEFEALLVAEDDGKSVEIGAPSVKGKKVTGKITSQGLAKKVDVIKFKSKIRYSRKYGHRQPFTNVLIESI